MSAQVSLPRRMRQTLPENGYESPRSPDDEISFGLGIGSGERKRVVPTKSSDNQDGLGSPYSRAHLNGGAGSARRKIVDEDGGKTKAGFRGRVGCFTWTWFTMTMATGGIANVLHSSKAVHSLCQQSSALMHYSSISLQLAYHHWNYLLLLQSFALSHEFNLDNFAVQVDSWLLSRLFYKSF